MSPIWLYVHNKILELSSISTIDYVNITAHYTALVTGQTNEDQALLDRGFTPEQVAAVRKTKKYPSVEINGLRFTVPLSHFKYSHMSYLLILLEQYELGNLPFEGPVADQPAQVMELLGLLKNTKAEVINREQKRQQNGEGQRRPRR